MLIKSFKRLLTNYRASMLIFPVVLTPLSLQAAPYELIDLGTLGGVENYSFAINEDNEVTGYSDGQIIDTEQVDEENLPPTCSLSDGTIVYKDFCNQAYLYSNGVITNLGDLGASISYGFAINDNSSVVGYGREEIDDGDPDTLNLVHERAFISFAGGELEPLPYPDEANDLAEGVLAQQRALGISNDRKIVGYTYIQFVNAAGEESSQNRPFLYDYDSDSFTILPLFSDEVLRSGSARSINSSGVVVGWALSEDEFNPAHALVWDPTSPDLSTDIGTLGGFSSDARDINDDGLVVGLSDTSEEFTDNQILAYIYDPAEEMMVAIPEFSDDEDFRTSSAYAINNNNQIVGTAQISAGFTPRSTAFLYDYNISTLINLNDMVDCSLNWDVVVARDINDSGVITGTGTIDGEVHSFMLIPTADTEPTNCTELRELEQENEEQELKDAAGSGSFGLLSLFLLSSMIYWRRRS